MKPKLVIALLVLLAGAHGKRPPWYKPCWIYLCGVEETDPVCSWDPHHGARLFRNNCEMDRHNFCYNRNYAVIDDDNNVAQDMQLCDKLKKMVENPEDKPAVVQVGNIKVHFLEDPVDALQDRRFADLDNPQDTTFSRRRYAVAKGGRGEYDGPGRRDRFGFRGARLGPGDRFSSSQSDSSGDR